MFLGKVRNTWPGPVSWLYSSQNLIKNKQNSFTGPLSYQDLRESASGPQSDRGGQEGGGGRGIGTCKSFTWGGSFPWYTQGLMGNVSLSNYTSLILEKDLIWAEPSSMGLSKEYSLPRDERVIARSRDSTISSSTNNDRYKFYPSKKR